MSEWKPNLCLYHGGCDDGFGAAWAIWKRWPDCEFVPCTYGTKIVADVAGKDVLFVDFSLKRDGIDAMAQSARSIIIIDHHKTAEVELAPFTVQFNEGTVLTPRDVPGMLRDLFEVGRPPIIAWFDMQQSGATMAWQFAVGAYLARHVMPEMLQLIEDRDLWRFDYGDRTRRFSAALKTYPMEFSWWTRIADHTQALVDEGLPILRAHDANVLKFIEQAYFANVGGYEVPVVNVPYQYASDTAHQLLRQFPDALFAAAWFRRRDGKIQWSLRSEDHRIDVSEVAREKGGGGHRNAAGFEEQAP